MIEAKKRLYNLLKINILFSYLMEQSLKLLKNLKY
jgi:hypothetical protein